MSPTSRCNRQLTVHLRKSFPYCYRRGLADTFEYNCVRQRLKRTGQISHIRLVLQNRSHWFGTRSWLYISIWITASWWPPTLDMMAHRIRSRLSCTYSDKPHAFLRPRLRLYHQRGSYVWSWWGLFQHPLRDACRIYRLFRNLNVSMILLNEVFRAHCNTITGETERAWYRQRWCGSGWTQKEI